MPAMRRVSGPMLALGILLGACGQQGVDWSAPENFVYRESSKKTDQGAQLEYWSLVDAPCPALYDALGDVEHYADFVPGVDRTQIIDVKPNSKTIQIAQRVIGRQSNAKVEWKFDRDKREIDFKTLQADLNYNDGSYRLEESPDGKRCLVRTTFLVREGQGMTQSVPIGVLTAGTREAFLSAAKGVKSRAIGTRRTG